MNPYIKLLGSTDIMSDSEEETPESGIQLSEENWIILKEFLHKEIDKYFDRCHKRRCWMCCGCRICSTCADAFVQCFWMQRQKLLDQQGLYVTAEHLEIGETLSLVGDCSL